MGILKLIASNNFITYNKSLAKIVGANSAIVFGALCSISSMFDDNEFFYQKERIEEDTALGEQAVRTSLKTLQDVGLITITKKGVPCKNWYKINESRLLELMDKIESISSSDGTSHITSNSTCGITTDSTSHITTDSTSDTTTNGTSHITVKNKHKNINKEYINNKQEVSEKPKPKKNNKAPLFDRINEYTENQELRDILKKWLTFKLSSSRGFTLDQFNMQLENLARYGGGDVQVAIEKVKSVYSKGYQSLVYENEIQKVKRKSALSTCDQFTQEQLSEEIPF